MAVGNQLPVRQIVLIFAVGIVLLTLGHAFFVLAFPSQQVEHSLARLVQLDAEANLPTWFSSSLLLACAAVLAAIWQISRATRRNDRHYWLLLSMFLLLLSIDEVAMLHETLGDWLDTLIDFPGLLAFSWVVPALGMLAGLILVFHRFFKLLPLRSRWLFFASGLLFMGAAVGMEMAGGAYGSRQGFDNLTYRLLTTARKEVQLWSTLLFLYAVLAHLRDFAPAVRLSLEEVEERAGSSPVQGPASTPRYGTLTSAIEHPRR